MRTAFIDTLFELATQDERITLVVGDLGFGVVNCFMKELPKQFVNAGIAEQNMTGLAVGMALSGKIVFTYSIGNFPTIRCLEQIRNDMCYHNANVKIVTVGGGMAYGSLGFSHHATEDLAIMRVMPNITVIAPNDPVEAGFATRAIIAHEGPCYLRLGRAGEPRILNKDVHFEIGKVITVREGRDLTFVVCGGLLQNVLEAAERLSRKGKQARVLSMHTIRPLDRDAIFAALRETAAIFTVEEHSITGGLGSAVAEVLMENHEHAFKFKRIGLNENVCLVGDQEYLRSMHGLNGEGIFAAVERALSLPN